jgi:hypothetical protein
MDGSAIVVCVNVDAVSAHEKLLDAFHNVSDGVVFDPYFEIHRSGDIQYGVLWIFQIMRKSKAVGVAANYW